MLARRSLSPHDQAGSSGDQPPDSASAARASLERGLRDRLLLFELAASRAFVDVCRHGGFLRDRTLSAGPCARRPSEEADPRGQASASDHKSRFLGPGCRHDGSPKQRACRRRGQPEMPADHGARRLSARQGRTVGVARLRPQRGGRRRAATVSTRDARARAAHDPQRHSREVENLLTPPSRRGQRRALSWRECLSSTDREARARPPRR